MLGCALAGADVVVLVLVAEESTSSDGEPHPATANMTIMTAAAAGSMMTRGLNQFTTNSPHSMSVLWL